VSSAWLIKENVLNRSVGEGTSHATFQTLQEVQRSGCDWVSCLATMSTHIISEKRWLLAWLSRVAALFMIAPNEMLRSDTITRERGREAAGGEAGIPLEGYQGARSRTDPDAARTSAPIVASVSLT
jgi:hypothetical protein